MPTVFKKKLSIQVPEKMLERLRDDAEREEMGISEFFRWALRVDLKKIGPHTEGKAI